MAIDTIHFWSEDRSFDLGAIGQTTVIGTSNRAISALRCLKAVVQGMVALATAWETLRRFGDGNGKFCLKLGLFETWSIQG